MTYGIIRVSRAAGGAWAVQDGHPGLGEKDFRVKSHAVAYARALSWSRHSTLLIDDDLGQPVCQSRASMTYPVRLD